MIGDNNNAIFKYSIIHFQLNVQMRDNMKF